MKKSTGISNQKQDGKITPAEVSIHEQVRREFEYSEDHGEPESEQLKNELDEPHYTLPSPMISREDAAFANPNPDQMGESFGLAFRGCKKFCVNPSSRQILISAKRLRNQWFGRIRRKSKNCIYTENRTRPALLPD